MVAADRFVPPFQYYGTVWPQPQSMRQEESFSVVSPNVDIVYGKESRHCEVLQDVFNRYGKLIRSVVNSGGIKKLRFSPDISEIEQIEVFVYNCEEHPKDGMNEAYTISADSGRVRIMAEAEWGVMHALETFAQLIHQIDHYSAVNTTFISDFPRFAFRGLLIDTSRHFLPVSVIKATITAMSWNKLNVLHWHIVDLDSFPYESIVLPNLAEQGSYTQYSHVYGIEDVENIIEFGRYRGVRVIPEFDTPGHVASWGPGAGEGFLTNCCDHNGEKNGLFGPIDPTVQSNYDLVNKLYSEVSNIFTDGYIHLGGDEVPFDCWKSNPNITAYMTKHNLKSYSELESIWVEGVIKMAQALNVEYIVWEEVFNNGVKIDSKTIVEVWKGRLDGGWKKTMKRVTEANHRAILSAPWYLNLISYGVDWQKYYKVEPTDFNGTDAEKQLVMGGSAAMWGEYVDGTNALSRTWPRASAVAERLWSAQHVTSTEKALPRLNEWRCRMLHRGLPAEPAIANINKPNRHHYGYCPTPYDPFNSDYLF